MKKIISILLAGVLLLTIGGCTQQSNEESNTTTAELPIQTESEEDIIAENSDTEESHILIAYFSWSGNTEQVAEEIWEQTGGDLFEIVPAEPYPDDFDETADRWHEERDSDARPEIIGQVEDMERYDIVFLGYPIWSSDLPAVNRTFLEQYDFSGKTIIPFCTHGGSSFGNSVNRIKELVPEAEIADGYETYGTDVSACTDEVAEWIKGLGLNQ